MTGTPADAWIPPAALFDEAPYNDYEDISYRTNPSCGSTWSGPNNGNGVGVLLIDVSRKAGTVVQITRFSVFQMTSDGATSSIRISRHTDTSDAAGPMFNDQAWVDVVAWSNIGTAIPANVPVPGGVGNVIQVTAKFNVEPFSTR